MARQVVGGDSAREQQLIDKVVGQIVVMIAACAPWLAAQRLERGEGGNHRLGLMIAAAKESARFAARGALYDFG